jgi:hypothetical protein
MTMPSDQPQTHLRAPAASAALSPERWRLGPNGQVRDMLARDSDRAVACIMHLWILSAAVLGPFAVLLPLGLWIALHQRSPLVDDHGREVMNAQITMLLLVVVVCVGWVLLVPWLLIWLVSLVRGSVAGAGGEIFRYPVLIRVIP